MVDTPNGFSFIKGIIITIFGFLVWIFAKATQNIVTSIKGGEILFLKLSIYFGIFIIIGGIGWYWIFRPLYYYLYQ